MPKLLRAAIIFFAVFAVGNAHALQKFDFEQKFFIEFGPEVKDHSLIRVDGTYHLFYLRGNPAVDIGHAVSTDLTHWKIEAPVLDVPNGWDNRVWAPQVKTFASGYIMYYTGVNDTGAQQTGVALSSDLYDWNRISSPVYHPDQSWALWSENTFSHGRDPFVFEYLGMSYMLNTAKTPNNQGAIALASSVNLINWSDEGPLYIHNTWHTLESLQMIEHNGSYHLFFTEEAIYGTSWSGNGGPNPLTGWDLSASSVIDFGHAPEINEFDPGVYTFSRHTTTPTPGGGTPQFVLRFDPLLWGGTFPYVDKPWPLSANWSIISGYAFYSSPTFLNNPALRGETVDIGYEGHCWLSTYEQYQGPLGMGAPGSYLGETATGVIRSRTFTLKGNSMNLLVGGTDSPDDCYVAMIHANNGNILRKETGKNTDEMDRREWDVKPYKGQQVYLEVVDNSASGHISVDDITESHAAAQGAAQAPTKGGPNRTREAASTLDTRAILHQNTPNPFNPSTTIGFELHQEANVSIDIFNVGGQRVRNLLSRRENLGTHQITWDGRNDAGVPMPSGTYFYRLTIDGRTMAAKKMLMLK